MYFFSTKKEPSFLLKIQRKNDFLGRKWVNNLTGIRIYQQSHKENFAVLTKIYRKTPNGVLTKITGGFLFCCDISTSIIPPIYTN